MRRSKQVAKAIVRAAPERAIWGSDWPHIPESGRDTGELLNLLRELGARCGRPATDPDRQSAAAVRLRPTTHERTEVRDRAERARHDRAIPTGRDRRSRQSVVRVVAMSFLIVMVDGYDTLMIAFIAPLLTEHWNLEPTDIGQMFADRLCRRDHRRGRWGRSPTGSGASRCWSRRCCSPLRDIACARSPQSFEHADGSCASSPASGSAARLPAVIALTAEHARPERRSGTVTLMYLGFPTGAVVGGALTAALLHLGWQTIFVYAAMRLPAGRPAWRWRFPNR